MKTWGDCAILALMICVVAGYFLALAITISWWILAVVLAFALCVGIVAVVIRVVTS